MALIPMEAKLVGGCSHFYGSGGKWWATRRRAAVKVGEGRRSGELQHLVEPLAAAAAASTCS